MFSEVELFRNVAMSAQLLNRKELVTRKFIATRLLEYLLAEKASKNHGYFLTVTKLKSIGKGEVIDDSGKMLFPVVFNCRTFLPVKGEVLQGVVHLVLSNGVFLRCGPVKYAFLSARKMPTYQYIPGERPVFLNEDLARIENDVVVRFSVLDVRWMEKMGSMRRDFAVLASLDGDSLGPISLCGSHELDL